MIIQKFNGVEAAQKAEGLVVVIDILRAATVEAYAFSKGAKYIIPVSTAKEAFALKRQHPEYLLMGEESGIKIDGFDYGNSPSEIQKLNLQNKIIVHRSSRGTQGLVSATKAEQLIFGSFVICSSIVAYINKNKFNNVSIVAMDDEDVIFTNYLEKTLLGQKTSKAQVKKDLSNHPDTKWYLDHQKKAFPKEDIDLALQIDKFNFICLVIRKNNQLITNKLIV